MGITFPGESLEYRAARDRLLEQELELRRAMEAVAAERYGADGYWVDPQRRRIPDHWHAHARPQGGFFGH